MFDSGLYCKIAERSEAHDCELLKFWSLEPMILDFFGYYYESIAEVYLAY